MVQAKAGSCDIGHLRAENIKGTDPPSRRDPALRRISRVGRNHQRKVGVIQIGKAVAALADRQRQRAAADDRLIDRGGRSTTSGIYQRHGHICARLDKDITAKR